MSKRYLYEKFGITKSELKNLLIVKYYLEKKTNKEISKELKCHRTNVTDWFKKFNLPLKTRNRTKPYNHPKKLNIGEAAFNSLYATYKAKARNRNLEFTLTKVEVEEIIIQNCKYCNVKPNQIAKTHSDNTGIFIHHGLDRIDSNLGYTYNNVVSCCGICNIMKQSLSTENFIQHIEKILAWTKKKN